MGTRGAIGFRLGAKDKVIYNHFDSYPTGIGYCVFNFMKHMNLATIRDKVKAIKLVNEHEKPNDLDIQRLKKYANLGVSEQSYSDWYCLLHRAQGNLQAYLDCGYMIDNQNFLKDSLFCEWAYIINLDESVLEIYKGFNKDKNALGRYALQKKDKQGYCGVRLITRQHLNFFNTMTDEEIMKYAKALQDTCYGE